MQVHVVIFCGWCKDKNMNQIHPQLFRWPLHPKDIYKMAQNPFHSSVHRWSNIQGSLGLPKHRYDGSETCLSFPLPHHHYPPHPLLLLSLLSHMQWGQDTGGQLRAPVQATLGWDLHRQLQPLPKANGSQEIPGGRPREKV